MNDVENAPSPMARKSSVLAPRKKSGLSARNTNIQQEAGSNSKGSKGSKAIECTPRSKRSTLSSSSSFAAASPVGWSGSLSMLLDADEDEVFFGTPKAAENTKANKLKKRRNTMLYNCEVRDVYALPSSSSLFIFWLQRFMIYSRTEVHVRGVCLASLPKCEAWCCCGRRDLGGGSKEEQNKRYNC